MANLLASDGSVNLGVDPQTLGLDTGGSTMSGAASQFQAYAENRAANLPAPPDPVTGLPPIDTNPGQDSIPTVAGPQSDPAGPPAPAQVGDPAGSDGDGLISTLAEVAASFAGEDGTPLTIDDLGHMTHQVGEQNFTLNQILSGFAKMPDAEAVLAQRYGMEQEFSSRNQQLDADHATALEALSGQSAVLKTLLARDSDPGTLATLAAGDPAGYAKAIQDMEAGRVALRNAEDTVAAQGRKRDESLNKVSAETRQRENRALAHSFPEWDDPVQGPAVRQRIYGYAATKGISAEELATIGDHRMLLVLNDASQGSALKDKGAKAIKAAKDRKLSAPRSPQDTRGEDPSAAKTADQGRAAAFERLTRTHSQEDVARVFDTLI